MSILNSKICSGFTSHTRFSPIKRTFSYDLSYLLIHLNSQEELDQYLGFKWDSSLFFSLKNQTYLDHSKESIFSKASRIIEQYAPTISYSSIYLLTCPTFFNLNFNPVSFFYYLDKDENIIAVIAEVHNTYKQKHLYLLTKPAIKRNGLHFESQKELHVSPFFKNEGKYYFLFSKNLGRINVSINYYKGTKKMFNANLSLTSSNISRFSFMKAGTKFIGTALSTFPRILIQAGILKLKHRLPHFKNNGIRSSFSSSRKQPSLFSKFCRKLVIQLLNKIKNGTITLYYPTGESDTFGSSDKDSIHAVIHVSDYKLFNHLVLKGDIGLADAFIQSYWSTPNLEDVFSIFITNDRLIKPSNKIVKLFKFFLRIQHGLRRNSISKAKQNIYDHYDLGNSFFQLFLDKHRVYSSAIFKSETESLESAQLNKIQRILEEADVKENHHILEIGSGWGGLAIYAAETIGCKVTTVTISQEQYDFVKKEINKRHLDHKIEVKLMDYRLLIGKYDRIVSIEMLEAVGHQYYSTFFDKCHDLLHRGGKAVFQCIMIPENRYNSYLKQPDFIQKYIFPGGHLPHLNLMKSKTKSSRFSWLNDYPITKHYVPTLHAWEKEFHQKADQIKELGFDKSFFNTWIYYFNYCSAGFKFDYIENHHFTIQKCH